jgi:myo-inositol-1(or 4)-monophosphatase
MIYDLPPELDRDRLAHTFDSAANAAAQHTLTRFRTELLVDNKFEIGFDPVTEADRAAEEAIRAVITAAFPDHSIIGEELEDKRTDSDFAWIIDPIDGTRAYISGVPVWGTLLGLMHKGRAIAGMMTQPYTGERWQAMGEETAFWWRDQKSRVITSTTTELGRAKATTTTPDMFTSAGLADAWSAISDRALQVRYGLDCYGYCLLASGHIDLVVETGLKDVDIAPLIPIIRGAGGVVTTWDGGDAEAGGNCIAAATPQLHAEAQRVLRDALGT